MPTRANRDTNSYGMKVGNGAQAPHTEIEDRICLNILASITFGNPTTALLYVTHITVRPRRLRQP